MEETSKKQLIYEKIIAIMKEIGAIAKNSENKTQNFMYRGIDAVMNALQPALIKNNVIMLPEVLSVLQAQTKTQYQYSKGYLALSRLRGRRRHDKAVCHVP